MHFYKTNQPQEVESVVLKYFIRELKLRGMLKFFFQEVPHAAAMYNAIKKFSNRNKRNEPSPNSESRGDSPFRNDFNLTDLVTTLKNLNRQMEGHHPPMPSGMDDKSQEISMCINHLIHFILERHVRDMDLFNSIGQNVFNYSCSYLYGKEYTDEQNRLDEQSRTAASDPEQLRGILWNMYMDMASHGYKDSFENFVKSYSQQMQSGQMGMPNPFEDEEYYDDEFPEEDEDYRNDVD